MAISKKLERKVTQALARDFFDYLYASNSMVANGIIPAAGPYSEGHSAGYYLGSEYMLSLLVDEVTRARISDEFRRIGFAAWQSYKAARDAGGYVTYSQYAPGKAAHAE